MRSETVGQTFRRLGNHGFCLQEIASAIPRFKGHVVCADSRLLEEPTVMVAVAAGGYLEGWVDRRTLRAVCKLYSLVGPAPVLGLPTRVRPKFGKFISVRDLYKPWFRWQRRDAFGSEGSGWGTYDMENCLGVADTRRFIHFFRRAWDGDLPVPFLPRGFNEPGRRLISIKAKKREQPLFRQFGLVQDLAWPVFRAEQFCQPVVAFWKS
jgi:hypothetical protein